MNKKMQKLLLDGDCLKAGVARGDVVVLAIPKQSAVNDFAMKQRSGILYGSTIFKDDQILYFYKKHNGNASAASRELRMSIGAYKQRLSKLGLRPTGKGGPLGKGPKYSAKSIRDALNKTKGNKKKAAKLIGCCRSVMYQRTY